VEAHVRTLKLVVSRKGKEYVLPIPSTEIGVGTLFLVAYGVYSGALGVDPHDALNTLIIMLSTLSS
jgi:hypothetical protein